MKISIDYIDNELIVCDDSVLSIQISNKNYFYRTVNDFYGMSQYDEIETIKIFDKTSREISDSLRIRVIINYFDLEFDSKKNTNDIMKLVHQEMDEKERDNILKKYNSLLNYYVKVIENMNFSFDISIENNVDSVIKSFKLNVSKKKCLFDNLLVLIDLENDLKNNNLLVFVNLKQFLKNDELEELYKYSIYNQVPIILIDSQEYNDKLNYERRIIVDSDLNEYVI